MYAMNEKGNYIGYHVEEKSEVRGRGLSMETLSDRFLYISPNYQDWFPDHLVAADLDYRILVIEFNKPEEHVYAKHEEFIRSHLLTKANSLKDEYKHLAVNNARDFNNLLSVLTPSSYMYYEKGVRMFSYYGCERKELLESFLVHPKDHVVSIKELEL